MSQRNVLMKSGRIGLASVILVAALLVAPLTSANAAPGVIQVPVVVASGATLGLATFMPTPTGGVMVQVHVSGFDPVGGGHRLALAVGGACQPLSTTCAASEVVALPDMQFLSNGSGDYTTVTWAVTMDWLAQTAGAALIIHADTGANSQVIGRATINAGWPGPGGWHPGGPGPGGPGPGGPGGWQPPQPQPAPIPIVGRFRVTASDGLRLRSGPGTWYAIWRIVGVGTSLQATGIERWGSGILWAKVRYGGVYYWAARDWLQAY